MNSSVYQQHAQPPAIQVRSTDFGLLGHADWDKVAYYRMPERRRAPDTEFDVNGLDDLPRVDISLTYAGSDGAAIEAFQAAGARGIVVAAMAPGYVTPTELKKLHATREAGVAIVHSTRAGSGRVGDVPSRRAVGTVLADNLTPQKARVLLTVALTKTENPEELQRIFNEY